MQSRNAATPAGKGRNRAALIALAISLAAVLAGCGGNDSASDATTAATTTSEIEKAPIADQLDALKAETIEAGKYEKTGPYTIALLNQGAVNGFGKSYEVTIDWAADGNPEIASYQMSQSRFDVQAQAKQLEDAIARDPDAIVVHPAGDGIVGPAKRAMEAGIPVVLCQNGLPDDSAFATMVANNYWTSGVEMSRWLGKELKGKGNVVLMGGFPTYEHTVTNEAALKNTLAAEYPGVKISATTASEYSVAKAKTDMEAILASNPTIDAVYTVGGEAAIGAIQALDARGVEMPLFAVSAFPNGFLRLAKEKDIKFIAAPSPATSSKYCLDTALDLLKGKSVARFIDAQEITPDSETFDYTALDDHFYPQFNDDFVGPAVAPESVYKEAGFGS